MSTTKTLEEAKADAKKTKDDKKVKLNKKNKTFFTLNKFIIESEPLLKQGICYIRYALNGKKFKTFTCPNEDIQNMIIDLCNNTFSLNKFDKLNKTDKTYFLKFCEMSHIDVGLSTSIEDSETQYKVYLGELEAGNPAPMIQFLFNSYSKNLLTKKDYLDALENIIKQ